MPIFPNFTDRTRPYFDTTGRALDALKSIWLNDPTGPLADDALMLSASYYLRKGDYVEADHMFELLRKEFPKTRHLENAYVLGCHCKLMSYQGPEYGGTELDDAKKLIQTTLHLYPNRPDRARMEADLRKIEIAKAAQLWANVKFWKVKSNPKAVAICCKEVIQKYPNSDYARLAREELAKIKPEDKIDRPHPKYEEKSAPPGWHWRAECLRRAGLAKTCARPAPAIPTPRGCKRCENVASGPWQAAKEACTQDVPPPALVPRRSTLSPYFFTAIAVLAASGCGYTIGNQFQHNVQTVYVPIATCEDFRRGTEFQLTEAVQKQIQARTPFRLAKDEAADTKLTMKIKSIRKTVLGTTAQNDARELQVQYAVEVTWEDLRTGRILAQNKVSIEPEVTRLFASGEFAPELGQSLATGTQEALDKMAHQIVDMMEAPW